MKDKHTMWKTPRVLEVAVGLEINCYACAELQRMVEKEYKMGRTGLFGKGRETTVRGSDKIKPYQGKTNLPPKGVTNVLNFVRKHKKTLFIAANAPGAWKVPAILGVLGAAYFGKEIKKYIDKRTGKGGNIAKKYLGADAPKDTGPKSLADSAKPDPIKKIRDAKKVPQGKAHGGKVHTKTYAKGGGVRKSKTYG